VWFIPDLGLVQPQVRAVSTSRVLCRASVLDDPEVRKMLTSAKRFSAAKGFSIKESPNETWESVAKRMTATSGAKEADDNEIDPAILKELEEFSKEQERAAKADAAAAAANLTKLGLNAEPVTDVCCCIATIN